MQDSFIYDTGKNFSMFKKQPAVPKNKPAIRWLIKDGRYTFFIEL
jgi:hypothetical protein